VVENEQVQITDDACNYRLAQKALLDGQARLGLSYLLIEAKKNSLTVKGLLLRSELLCQSALSFGEGEAAVGLFEIDRAYKLITAVLLEMSAFVAKSSGTNIEKHAKSDNKMFDFLDSVDPKAIFNFLLQKRHQVLA